MDKTKVIASCLVTNELAQAFSELVAERWDNWDLSPFMAYLLDTCAVDALPYLAEQFDVDGLRGFAMATDEAQQRELIKRSIALHKFIGTPWAIREACRTIGFPIIVLEEGVTIPGEEPSTEDWAQFRILVEAAPDRHITVEEARKLRLFVEFYKNERSHLIELGFYLLFRNDKLFNSPLEERERLIYYSLQIIPNPIVLDKSGNVATVKISVNTPWTMPMEINWNNSEDKIKFEFTGNEGESQIIITSDPYTLPATIGEGAYSGAYSSAYTRTENAMYREKSIEITTPSGLVLGTLTVQQIFNWSNAYSRAYSRAYNNYETTTYLRVIPATILLPSKPENGETVNVESNTDWTII